MLRVLPPRNAKCFSLAPSYTTDGGVTRLIHPCWTSGRERQESMGRVEEVQCMSLSKYVNITTPPACVKAACLTSR
ncbi:hypothetical protein E2C01_021787 [Portunus trituberculatus]|uniref:Uncharacterized protein n=1 Tax=Portunus trituberculatus TaxID=210409 RepID=A0A5B7E4C0_PORTR|nr:hypothetical protein [Portunus trituberculatus]